MTTVTSSIDDVLMGAATSAESIAESIPDYEPEPQVSEEVEASIEPEESGEYNYEPTEDILDKREPVKKKEAKSDEELDDYGNEKPKENEVIRDRLARQAESLKRQHQAELDALRAQLTPQQNQAVNQAASDFQYDENSNQSWDQQLRQFVEQTVQSMSQRQQQEVEQAKQQKAQREFEDKFRDDVQRFPDFEQTIVNVGAPITDPMVYATRGMQNPAAFLYAAAKRAPKELQRIASIGDPYVQIAEMGRLEASLRQTKSATKAPKPLGRLQEDGVIHHKTEREPTIEDLIARSDAKRRAQLNARRGR